MKIVLAQMTEGVYESFVAAVERIEGVDILYAGPDGTMAKQLGTDAVASLFYSYWFDENSHHFTKAPHAEYNKLFLRFQQNWANDMLRDRGHLFLNEIFDVLGLPRSKVGSLVGWIYEEGVHVDFGANTPREDGSIMLDFNVQGVIVHKLK